MCTGFCPAYSPAGVMIALRQPLTISNVSFSDGSIVEQAGNAEVCMIVGC